MELDENAETLREAQLSLEDAFQTADHDHPINQTILNNFKARIDLFAKDFASFKRLCSTCRTSQFLSKILHYADVLNRAKELWEIIAA